MMTDYAPTIRYLETQVLPLVTTEKARAFIGQAITHLMTTTDEPLPDDRPIRTDRGGYDV